MCSGGLYSENAEISIMHRGMTHGGSAVIAHRPSDRPASGTSWI